MSRGYVAFEYSDPRPFPGSGWAHPIVSTNPQFLFRPWSAIGNHHRFRQPAGRHVRSLNTRRHVLHRGDDGLTGLRCRTQGHCPPSLSSHKTAVYSIPRTTDQHIAQTNRFAWVNEHLAMTAKHIPNRVPLPDKGKPVAKRGRKATDQASDLTAGLPEEE